MSAAIDFAVRDAAGGKTVGNVAGDGQANFIQVGDGDSISLNVARESVLGYQRVEGDLVVELADGRTVVLLGYFDVPEGVVNHLYLSTDGSISEVMLTEGGEGGYMVAGYGPASPFDKWSPLDDLRFDEGDPVVAAAATSDEPAGMGIFAPALIGGGAGLGTAAVIGGAALAGGAALVGGGGGGDGSGGPNGGGGQNGGGGGGGNPAVVTVPGINGAGTSQVLSSNPAGQSLQVTGTGQPGDTVVVKVGTSTQTTTILPNGTWSATFDTNHLPPDGNYQVKATFSGSTSVTLTGGDVLIDMTPPPLSVTQGTGSVGDVENLAEYADGVTLKGRGEAGASVSVKIGLVTHDTVVAADGSWSVTFSQSELAGGERTVPVTITSTDIHNNITRVTDTVVLDTVPHALTVAQVGGDGWVNRAENGQPVVVSGTTAAGAVVTLTIPGVVAGVQVTANAQGRWSYSVPAGTLADSTYTVEATTVDAVGNPSRATGAFSVDTQSALTVGPAPGGADGVLSGAERLAGYTLEGTADANARVFVNYNGQVTQVQAGADGRWSLAMANLAQGEVAAGSLGGRITVYAEDALGNRSDTVTRDFAVDTIVRDFTYANPDLVGAVNDGPRDAEKLNAAERQAGLVVQGTVEPGSFVTIQVGQFSTTISPADTANGRWSYTIPAAALPQGPDATATISVRAQDAYGNQTAWSSKTVAIDTELTNFARGDIALGLGADNVLNAREAAAGVPISGRAEAGSTVTVTVDGRSHVVTAGADGLWTTTFARSELPSGTRGNVTALVEAVDPHGNRGQHSFTFSVDTDAPNAPDWVQDSGGGGALSGVFTAYSPDVYTYHSVGAAGPAVNITPAMGAFRTPVMVNGQAVDSELALFSQNVPDGSYLVIRDVDGAGNEASTLYLRTTGEAIVDLNRPGLAGFDIAAIDLSSTQGRLTISAAQLQALTGPDQKLTIHGEADDRVTLQGAQAAGTHQGADGQTYAVYTLGGATVYVDEDINRTVI